MQPLRQLSYGPSKLIIALGAMLSFCLALPSHAQRDWEIPIATSQSLKVSGATLQIDFAQGKLDLPPAQILPWIERAAQAIVVYYGRFPVPSARVLIVPVSGRHGIVQGTTWGEMRGFPGFTRIRLGEHTTVADLTEDWTMTHELVHMAFPSLPDDQHWMEEGLATYIEPVARVQAGELQPERIWRDMLDGMPKGEPAPGDQGMDNTHTWGRTYWGGALFCLVADVEIHKQTGNRKGLRDAMRAILAAGGSIDHDWPLMRALEIGDKATGTHVLTTQYKQWSDHPMPVDLPALWKSLGVAASGDTASFDSKAPLAAVRAAITTR
ncbi:MAG TPA: hypothetical protein VL346_03550 [Acidobacteriaceae bacterium]|nr:hypothetical protein [Acidobacteriaceae bacterium]